MPVPPEALREVLLNAVTHRDYTHPSSYVAVVVFDDRIEVRSLGRLPRGVTAESLSLRRKQPGELLLRSVELGQAPLLNDFDETQQRSCDATARKLLRFLSAES